MVDYVRQFLPLAGLIESTRAILTPSSSVSEVKSAVESSGLTTFVKKQLTAVSGVTHTQFAILPTNQFTADTFGAVLNSDLMALSPQVKKNTLAMVRSYGLEQTMLTNPSTRDLFLYANKRISKVSLPIINPEKFQIVLRMSKRFFLPEDDGSFLFSAREAAGVLCHEIGHTVWNYRAADTIIQQDGLYHQVVEFVRGHPPVSDIIAILKILDTRKDLPPYVKKAIEALLAHSATDDSKDYQTFSELAVWAIMAASANNKKVALNTLFPKQADRSHSGRPDTDKERFCDSFSGLCGYGGDLAKALTKMSHLKYAPAAYTLRMGQSGIEGFLSAILSPNDEIAAYGYDSLYDRLFQSIASSKLALTNDDLPQDVKARIVKSIDEGEAFYNVYTSQPYVVLRHALSKVYTAWDYSKGLSFLSLKAALESTLTDFNAALRVYNGGDLAYFASLLETATHR